MKRLIIIFLASISMLFSPAQAIIKPVRPHLEAVKESVVYITKTGKKYHKGDCSYLKQSKIQTTKKEAIANGYTACSRCNP